MSRNHEDAAARSGVEEAAALSAEMPLAAAEQVKRPRGRPRANRDAASPALISRAAILRTAYKMARTIPLQEISVVLVSRELKVTPALIHYYIGSRDWLTSGVMNLFYRDLVRQWPELGPDWRRNMQVVAQTAYAHFTEYSGVAAYAVSNNRFTVFQLTAFGDKDHGLEILERFAACVRTAGRSGDRTGIYAHLLRDFIVRSAYSTARHMYPSEHQQFLKEKTDKLDPLKYPNIAFASSAAAMLDAKAAFEEGLQMFIAGLEKAPVESICDDA